ncbi:AraC family transcriptional regulator [Shewanella sp. SR44-3]|uniref:AraC family transcriptional regulator n=1 Tax=unclassified Shewanella TaxID=196818 RepID=UPI0015FDAFF5|nr:AraC family transcriptional regulator [Shewanella sp. SR44-3]MBB1270027.1 helix-turn-helix transcriptional regulator [Shewanella sp. SR44-3]
MKTSLSIRAYTKQLNCHIHDSYHQLVLPLQGNIHIDMHGFIGKVTVGECVVIPKGVAHGFNADEVARFIVADLEMLPAHLINNSLAVFSITPPLLSFINFVQRQLEYQVDQAIEDSMMNTFNLLLEQQELVQSVDPRIRVVLATIAEKLETPLTIINLAEAAYLSPTQFKKLFKDNVGTSVHKYITLQRMEKAKALLSHTDLPVQLVADRVGYTDLSAFSRRFSMHFGASPREFSRT